MGGERILSSGEELDRPAATTEARALEKRILDLSAVDMVISRYRTLKLKSRYTAGVEDPITDKALR